MIQNLADAQSVAAHMHSPSIRSGLLHTPDSVHRTGDHAVVVLHIPPADESHGPGERLMDVNEMPSHPIAISIEQVRRVTQATERQLASPPSTTRASCPTALCRWRDEGAANICGDAIPCNDVPAHFKYDHAIENINEYLLVDCRWEMCFTKVVRKNFARHVRECHLLHVRKQGHVIPQTDGV
ncbi:hypothetical protein JVT61DRAFT_11626 [Boletus reticuloceps]|uniref:Uncharacterized protein n=1 Tax=Boletus reticuloceps TaxID=495285 RepID=A0A8I2YY85_9AGAM|nr:hypothetical protein JVT61DRAFT_11626 [Boletus reticuloceps]